MHLLWEGLPIGTFMPIPACKRYPVGSPQTHTNFYGLCSRPAGHCTKQQWSKNLNWFAFMRAKILPGKTQLAHSIDRNLRLKKKKWPESFPYRCFRPSERYLNYKVSFCREVWIIFACNCVLMSYICFTVEITMSYRFSLSGSLWSHAIFSKCNTEYSSLVCWSWAGGELLKTAFENLNISFMLLWECENVSEWSMNYGPQSCE